jgi:hypothetical protein
MNPMTPLHGGDGDDVDLMDIAETDAWLDQVAGRSAALSDPLALALVSWLAGIDAEHVPAEAALPETDLGSIDLTEPVDIRSGRRYRSRAMAAAAILGATSLVGAGVAAASPGSPLYPVHRVVFGLAHPKHSALDHASALLDRANEIITSAQQHHRLTASDQAKAGQLLAQAGSALSDAPRGARRDALLARDGTLTAALAALVAAAAPSPAAPSATAGPSVPPESTRSHSGPSASPDSGNHGTGGSGSGSGDHRESKGSRSGSGSGDHHGSGSGTGHGNGSGSGSGSGSGDHNGSGSGSGSGHGSGSGTGSGSGSGDGSGGSGSGSGGGSSGGQGSGSGSGDGHGSGG